MSNVIAQMDARFGGGANPPVGQVPVAPQIKVTLQQVMALCQEVRGQEQLQERLHCDSYKHGH